MVRPDRGLIFVRGVSGSGKTRSYLLETLRRIHIRGDIADQLRHHRYPAPIPFLPPRDHLLEGYERIEFASTLQTFSRSDTLGEIFGGRERLWRAWRRTRLQSCPTCDGSVSSLPPLSHILTAAKNLHYEEVTISLTRTTSNSEKHPRVFLRSSPRGDSEVEHFVDRIAGSHPTTDRRLADALRSAIEPGDGKLGLQFRFSNGDTTVRHYSREPTCERCGSVYARISQSTFSLKIDPERSADSPCTFDHWAQRDLSRITLGTIPLGGTTLRELLELSLGELPDDSSVFPTIGSIARSLGLDRITLLRPFDTLSTTEQLRALILKALIAREFEDPIVVDGVLGGFEEEQRTDLLTTLSEHASNSIVVVIDPEGCTTADQLTECSAQMPTRKTTKSSSASHVRPPDKGEITSFLDQPGPSIISVAGPAASGKSSAIAEALRCDRPERPPDIVHWKWYDPFSARPATTVAEFLGVSDPLFALLAESEGARMEGIRATDLARRSRSGMKNSCRKCLGLGVVFDDYSGLRFGTTCQSCDGYPLVRTFDRATFRGLAWPALARLSIDEADRITRGISRLNGPLKLLNEAGCGRPFLGAPVTLLSQREWHVCSLLHELLSVRRNGLVVIDHPFAGLDSHQRDALMRVIETICRERSTVAILEHLGPDPAVTGRALQALLR